MKTIKIRLITLVLFMCMLAGTACNSKKDILKEVGPDERKEQIYRSSLTEKIVKRSTIIKKLLSDTLIKIHEGVTETQISYVNQGGKAMKVFIVEADLKNSKISLRTMTPNNNIAYGNQNLMTMVEKNTQVGKTVLAAVNGDFFSGGGIPQSVFYQDGKAIKTSSCDQCTYLVMYDDKTMTVGGIDKDGRPRAVNTGRIQVAIGGWYWLLDRGLSANYNVESVEPRTTVGYTSAGMVYFLVVDGRSAAYSNGMNYTDMQAILQSLGVYDAINLDGGGSTSLVVKTQNKAEWTVHNKPSDGKLRAVANGISIISQE